jgi:hypothetical protein
MKGGRRKYCRQDMWGIITITNAVVNAMNIELRVRSTAEASSCINIEIQ